MRTNIVLNDELLKRAMRYSRATTKKDLVQEALREYVALKEAEMKRASYTERLGEIRKRVAGMKRSETSQDIVRNDRERDT
jgi:Arc/MetJ family transcription regulator